MRKQHYMTEQERHQLEAMRRNKIPVREIARQLGFCERTIYYELRRGSYMHTCDFWDEKRYSAQKGQQTHNYNQTAKGRPLKIGCDHTYATYIEHKIIVDRYSPAAALAAAKRYNFQTHICVSTLYSYIKVRNSAIFEANKVFVDRLNGGNHILLNRIANINCNPTVIGKITISEIHTLINILKALIYLFLQITIRPRRRYRRSCNRAARTGRMIINNRLIEIIRTAASRRSRLIKFAFGAV